MSTQDRINQLASAALRSSPSAGAPKPATFMPSFEQLKAAQVAAQSVQVPANRIGVALNDFDLAFATVVPRQG